MPAIALYIHWPYCSRICPYCDFNVTRDRGQIETQTALFEALRLDLKAQAQTLGPRHLVSVFFGGGTPSLMKPQWVAQLIDDARALFPPQSQIEITLEANPTDAEISRYKAFKVAGINRLSIGIQSLNDAALKFLGRNHSAREALLGLETARSVFDRVSLDLIYALPDQTLADWESELTGAASLGIEHISPYQLSLEPETAFGRLARRGKLTLPAAEMGEAFYYQTQATLARLGFETYEVSNHARGEAARSQHNVNIWEGVDYIGIGPGAHGRLTFDGARHATVAESDLKTYIAHIQTFQNGGLMERLTAQDRDEEALMLGLRLIEGVSLDRIASLPRLKQPQLIADGFLELTHNRLRATPKGRVVLDRILLELLA